MFGEDCVISGSYDNDCRLWSLKSGNCLAVLSGHTNKIYAVTATATSILSGSLDGTVKIWDPQSGTCQQTLLGHRSLVGLVLAKPDLRRNFVVSGSTDGSLQLINPAGVDQGLPASHVLIPSAHDTSLTSLDFNRRFMITGSEGLVRLWALPAGGCSGEPKPLAKLVDAMDMVWRVAVSENLAVVAYQLKGQTRLAILNFTPTPEQFVVASKPRPVIQPMPAKAAQLPLFGNVFYDAQQIIKTDDQDDETAMLTLYLANQQRLRRQGQGHE
jgi:F-box and WD-40 domain protein CDC4